MKKFGHEPAAYSAYYYDAFMIIKDAIEESNGPESTRNAIQNTGYSGLLGNFTFFPNHDADLSVFVFKLESGEFMLAE